MAFNSNYFSISNKDVKGDENLRWSVIEPVQKHRGEFSKDRDRILYAKSFLRLRGKTQVFMLQYNDYIRTRMTHTLEVNQIAKTIALALGQNVELVEAIAFGHDVGHTPFGHIGERTLKKLLEADESTPDNQKGFKHNLQALRLLCLLEKGADYPETSGLNLTKYTLWGISHHSSIKRRLEDEQGNLFDPNVVVTENPFYDAYLNAIKDYWSFEGYIVALADEIAQRHHDIEDSIRFGVVNRKTIVEKLASFRPLFSAADKKTFEKLVNGIETLDDPVFSSVYSRLVVNVYVVNAVNNSKNNLRRLCRQYHINSHDDFTNTRANIPELEHSNVISFSERLTQLDNSFQSFLMESVLSSFPAQAMDGKGEYIINKLYSAFANNPSQLPDTALRSFCQQVGVDFSRSTAKNLVADNLAILHRCIVDYIGGMTDRFAYEEYDRLYGTKF